MLGRFVAMICSIAFIRYYVRLLGVEGFALCGFQVMLTGLLSPLEMGLSTSLNRELASRSTSPESARQIRTLVQTMTSLYSGLALTLFMLLSLAVPFFAERWLTNQTLEPNVLRSSLHLIAAVVAVQFPIILFSSGLYGLQRHLSLNLLNIVFTIIRTGGVVPFLMVLGATPTHFWLWNLIWYCLHGLLLGLLLFRSIPESPNTSWLDLSELRRMGKFAAGVAGTSILGIILMQADKVILSKLLSLEEFGYYTIAFTAASGLNMLVAPIFATFFPKFTSLFSSRQEYKLAESYHLGCQTVAALTIPAGLFGIFWASPILLLWLGNQEVANSAGPTFAVYLAGSTLNSLIMIPYALQLAHGIPRIAFFQNLVAVVVFLPLVAVLASHWQTVGAASAWAFVNAGFVFAGVPYMHKYIFSEEMRAWYMKDVLEPLIGASGAFLLALVLENSFFGDLPMVWKMLLILLMGFSGASLMASHVRHSLKAILQSWTQRRQTSCGNDILS